MVQTPFDFLVIAKFLNSIFIYVVLLNLSVIKSDDKSFTTCFRIILIELTDCYYITAPFLCLSRSVHSVLYKQTSFVTCYHYNILHYHCVLFAKLQG